MGIICISLATFKPFLWTYCPWLIGAASRNRSYPPGYNRNTNSEASKKWSRKATGGGSGNGDDGDRTHKSFSMGTWSKKKKNDLESFDYGKLDESGQTTVNVQKTSTPGSETSPRGSTDQIIRCNGNTNECPGIVKTTQVLVRNEETDGKTQEKIAGHYPSC